MDVNQIFKDLGMLVHEQGEVLGMLHIFHEKKAVLTEKWPLRYQILIKHWYCDVHSDIGTCTFFDGPFRDK